MVRRRQPKGRSVQPRARYLYIWNTSPKRQGAGNRTGEPPSQNMDAERVARSSTASGWRTQSHGSTADALRPPGCRRAPNGESSAHRCVVEGDGLTILGVSGPGAGRAGPWGGTPGTLDKAYG